MWAYITMSVFVSFLSINSSSGGKQAADTRGASFKGEEVKDGEKKRKKDGVHSVYPQLYCYIYFYHRNADGGR